MTYAELKELAEGLSELLTSAVREEGELGANDRERMGSLQRRVYALKHPEQVVECKTLVFEGDAWLEPADTSNPEAGPPDQLVVDGWEVANRVEAEVESLGVMSVANPWPYGDSATRLPRLRVTVEVLAGEEEVDG